MTSGIPTLTDAIDAALFPRTNLLAARRVAGLHWKSCAFSQHYRERAAAAGTFKVAKQLRKQGIKIETALAVLARKP